jgi:glycerol-3-phosphate acyltransferase PlsY
MRVPLDTMETVPLAGVVTTGAAGGVVSTVKVLVLELALVLPAASVAVAVTVVVVVLGAVGMVAWSVTLAIVAITGIIVVKHESNIRRLLTGTERRFGEPAS